jgi:hypothetical protein
MNTNETTPASGKVACTVCMKEVPLTEVIVPEAIDYVAHFCGVECYDKWRKQAGNPYTQDEIPTTLMPL